MALELNPCPSKKGGWPLRVLWMSFIGFCLVSILSILHLTSRLTQSQSDQVTVNDGTALHDWEMPPPFKRRTNLTRTSASPTVRTKSRPSRPSSLATVTSTSSATVNSTTTTSTTTTTTTPVRKWAYAFLVGGVLDPETNYRGFLYAVVVSAKIFRDSGSAADVVVMIQLSYNTNATTLPQDELDLLTSVGVKIKYLPKFAARVHEQFYALVMEKFRVLELTEYSRVIFLDSDITPLCSMDYLFDQSEPIETIDGGPSEPPLLKENAVLSWKNEPGHAGFFMLAPGPDKFKELQKIIRRREEEILTMKFPFWNQVTGWGHTFSNTDYWRSQWGINGTLWNWWSSFADQGLIYFWCKYHLKSTSLIIGDEIENWGTDESGALRLERTIPGSPLQSFSCANSRVGDEPPPYRDYEHFVGKKKPWWMNYTDREELLHNETKNNTISLGSQWFSILQSVAKNIGYNISQSAFGESRFVGAFSDKRSMYNHTKAKQKRGWTAYQE